MPRPYYVDDGWCTSILDEITDGYSAVSYDELDQMLAGKDLRAPWRRTHIVRKLTLYGWARYRGTRRPERGGKACFILLRPDADPATLPTWAPEHGILPTGIRLINESAPRDPKGPTPAQSAAADLAAYFLHWRDYCRAQMEA